MRHALVAFLAFAAACTHDTLKNLTVDGGTDATILADGGSATGTPCDILNASSCPPGYHCVVSGPPDDAGVGKNVCVPGGLNPIPAGGSCHVLSLDGAFDGDFCEAGTVCMHVASGVSRCAKPCFQHQDCAANQACGALPSVQSPTTKKILNQTVNLAGCVTDEGCDPVAQTGCPDQRCAFSASDGEFRARVCATASGHLTQGASCASSAECAPGFICGALGFCLQICYQNPPPDARVSGQCPSPYLCDPFSGSTATYGRCE